MQFPAVVRKDFPPVILIGEDDPDCRRSCSGRTKPKAQPRADQSVLLECATGDWRAQGGIAAAHPLAAAAGQQALAQARPPSVGPTDGGRGRGMGADGAGGWRQVSSTRAGADTPRHRRRWPWPCPLGPLAAAIARAVQQTGGSMTVDDLAPPAAVVAPPPYIEAVRRGGSQPLLCNNALHRD